MQVIEEDTVAEAEILPKAALLHDYKLIQEPHPLITPFLWSQKHISSFLSALIELLHWLKLHRSALQALALTSS